MDSGSCTAGRTWAGRPGVLRTGRAAAVLDLLQLLELARHDCCGDATSPDDVVDDIRVVAQDGVASLARVAWLAVDDSRDLSFAADEVRRRPTWQPCIGTSRSIEW